MFDVNPAENGLGQLKRESGGNIDKDLRGSTQKSRIYNTISTLVKLNGIAIFKHKYTFPNIEETN